MGKEDAAPGTVSGAAPPLFDMRVVGDPSPSLPASPPLFLQAKKGNADTVPGVGSLAAPPLYDLLVIDEGSQMPLALAVGPLRQLKNTGRLVVAGDFLQASQRPLSPIWLGQLDRASVNLTEALIEVTEPRSDRP